MNLDDDWEQVIVAPSMPPWGTTPDGPPNPVGLYNRVEQKVPSGSAASGDGSAQLPPCEPPSLDESAPAPTKKSLTAGKRFWLWFRFPLAGLGICAALGAAAFLVACVISLFDTGHWLIGLVIIALLLSFGGGQLAYATDRHDCPKDYR